MSFRLVPNSVILDDLERHYVWIKNMSRLVSGRTNHDGKTFVCNHGCLHRSNSPNLCVLLPNSVAFGADYVKVVEDTPVLSAAEM